MGQSRARHSFAPLKTHEDGDRERGVMRLKGIVFDMDGTLCMMSSSKFNSRYEDHQAYHVNKKGEPQNYMFAEMRSQVGIPDDRDILDYIHSLPEVGQTEAFAKVQAIERRAMANQVPQPGLVRLMEYLDSKGIKKGILTRNFDAPVMHLLKNHFPSHISPFSSILTRDFRPPKPSPAGVLHIAQAWGAVDDAETPHARNERRLLPIVMVGDSIDDMTAGYDAGALTVLLRSAGKEDLEQDEKTDVTIGRLDKLIELLEEGLSSSRTSAMSDSARI